MSNLPPVFELRFLHDYELELFDQSVSNTSLFAEDFEEKSDATLIFGSVLLLMKSAKKWE